MTSPEPGASDVVEQLEREARRILNTTTGPYERRSPEVIARQSAEKMLRDIAALRTSLSRMEMRSDRQKRIAEWCAAAFGQDHASDIEQRGLRLAEEAIEAAQAANCDPATLHKLIDYIYAKPPGEIAQELGGVGLCLLAMANAVGIDADVSEEAECQRVLSKPLEFFAARNKVKNDAGFVSGAYRQPLPSAPILSNKGE